MSCVCVSLVALSVATMGGRTGEEKGGRGMGERKWERDTNLVCRGLMSWS